MTIYFSRKQYFRDTTAPAGLSEVINVRQALPVKPKQKIFPEPLLLNQRSDYFGNDLFTYRDIQGNIKTISIMKGANKPRGINANVKWSMSPNKFKRGRGLNSRDGFIKPMSRRGETTEFFKSRYQSAYGEMLIQQKIKDADKLSKKKTKVLKDELKKKEDKINALISSNAQTIQNLKDQNKADMDTLKLQLGVMYSGGMSGGGFQGGQRPTGFSSDTVGDTGTDPILSKGKGGGKGGGKGKPAPPPPPPSKPPPRPKTAEEIEAERLAIIGSGGGGMDEVFKAINQGLTPAQIKKMKQDAKKEKKDKLKAIKQLEKEQKKQKKAGGGEAPTIGSALSLAVPLIGEKTIQPAEEPSDEPSVEDTGAGVSFTEQPLEEGFLEKTITAPELTSKQKQQQSVVDILETSFEEDPQGEAPTQPVKSRFSKFKDIVSAPFKKSDEPEVLDTPPQEPDRPPPPPPPQEPDRPPPPPPVERKTMPAPPFETPPIPPPLSEAQKTELKIPASSLPPVESPIIAPPLSQAQKTELKIPASSLPPVETPNIPPLSQAKPQFNPSVEIEGFFSDYIQEAIRDSDNKGDYFDNLRVVNERLKKDFGEFSSKVPSLSENTMKKLVSIYPQQPSYKVKETADEPEPELSIKEQIQKATQKPPVKPLTFVEPTPAQQRKESVDRQLKVLEDKYSGINFKKSPTKILEDMFKQINSQNLSADLLEPTINRAVQDLNSHLNLRGKNRVGKKTIDKVKLKVFT